MQKTTWLSETSGRERMSEIARMIVGITLLVLVVGIWVCLWVPPSPIF
jgi:type II secretory pathway component PulM